MKKSINIGIDVPAPVKSCNDNNCPFHGTLRVRGRSFVGKIIRISFQKNALVEWQRKKYLPKFERYEKRRTRVWAHAPECLDVHVGDTVTIVETKKISKTKCFVIIQKQ
ncbi:MAG: 30S ribosomal protein S17 [Candidatus Woesearchaeota archaeon]